MLQNCTDSGVERHHQLGNKLVHSTSKRRERRAPVAVLTCSPFRHSLEIALAICRSHVTFAGELDTLLFLGAW
jgi:hypothetical protein